jgi:DNA-binding transcriptional regulator YhcF (GntR family)
VPRAQRQQPLWKQIADDLKGRIARGELSSGDRLPSIRELREEWGVSQGVAQQAVNHLHLAERLVRTDATGTYVDSTRAVISPQARMALTAAPASEVVTVTAAELTAVPDYIRTTLNLPAWTAQVIRREEVVTLADGTPHMLSVTWCNPEALGAVPELLHAEPLPDPRGAAHLIADRTGRDPAALSGGISLECRLAKDDDRELPALGLEPGAYVLAGVNGWRDGEDVLAYTEWVLPPGRVIEAEIEA